MHLLLFFSLFKIYFINVFSFYIFLQIKKVVIIKYLIILHNFITFVYQLTVKVIIWTTEWHFIFQSFCFLAKRVYSFKWNHLHLTLKVTHDSSFTCLSHNCFKNLPLVHYFNLQTQSIFRFHKRQRFAVLIDYSTANRIKKVFRSVFHFCTT